MNTPKLPHLPHTVTHETAGTFNTPEKLARFYWGKYEDALRTAQLHFKPIELLVKHPASLGRLPNDLESMQQRDLAVRLYKQSQEYLAYHKRWKATPAKHSQTPFPSTLRPQPATPLVEDEFIPVHTLTAKENEASILKKKRLANPNINILRHAKLRAKNPSSPKP